MGIVRFILALTVVLSHSTPLFGTNFVGGKLAVQAFYIVSGFYMTLILREKYIGENKSYKLFITNRFLRLYPIYWVILILSILYSISDPKNSFGNKFAALSYYLKYFDSMSLKTFCFLLLTNLIVFFQDAVMFLGLNTSDGNLFLTSNFRNTNPELFRFLFVPQAWTIGIELTFYLIAPFLVRENIKKIYIYIFLSLLLRLFIYKNGLSNDPWSYRFFPTELTFFLLGSVSYHILVQIRNKSLPILYLKTCWYIILLATVIYDFLHIPGKSYLYLFLFFVCLPFIFMLSKNWVYDRYIGELSYPMYISHLFVLSCITALKVPLIGSLGLTLSIFTVLFSIALNELLVKRIERIRQRRIKPIL